MGATGTPGQTDSATGSANPPVLGGVAPYLSLRDAGAAAEFYKRAFGAQEVNRMPPTTRGGRCTSTWSSTAAR